MPVYIVLLRAVNVGGTGRLPMPAFKNACERAGLRDVSTYVASGNLVCASDGGPTTVHDIVSGVVRDEFGLTKNETFVRTAAEWEAIVAGNPFPDAARDRPNTIQLHLFDGMPVAKGLDSFVGPERIHLADMRIYIDYPNGIGRSKLTQAVLDRALRVPSTGRNWNTVLRLMNMARATAAT